MSLGPALFGTGFQSCDLGTLIFLRLSARFDGPYNEGSHWWRRWGGNLSCRWLARVGKEHPRVAIYGAIDEANSAIGLVRSEINHRPIGDGRRLAEADRMLGIIQQELFDVGAECACPPGGFQSRCR